MKNPSPTPESVTQFLNRMSLEEKVGQMLVFGFGGTYPHPDILDAIRRQHVAGFRVSPFSRKFARYLSPGSPGFERVLRDPEPLERVYGLKQNAPRVSAGRYAQTLNRLRETAMESGAGVPLYFATDYEGNPSMDCFMRGFLPVPHPMGLAASGDGELSRQVAALVGRMLRAVGINWVHSPVLDVNTHPENPEIGTRSYSPDPQTVIAHALKSLEGFDEAGVIATGKHFPGRGHSVEDVHFGIATISESAERMHEVHLAPYRALIEAGLPAIMLAHSIFPEIDPSQEIATLSKPIVTGLLREEMGYDGVIMTDSFTMGGLVAKYEVPEAAIRSIEAGVDLILLKDENALRGEVYEGLVNAVRSGRLSEEQVEEAARRVLTAKARAGLLDGSGGLVDPEAAESQLTEPRNRDTAREAFQRSTVVLRDRGSQLPLKPGAKLLVVEQVSGLSSLVNTEEGHTGALQEALLDRGFDARLVDFRSEEEFDAVWPHIQKSADEVDAIVHFGYYNRGSKAMKEPHARIAGLPTPSIFVSNDPYNYLVSDEMDTVVVPFSPMTLAMEAAADVICGKNTAPAKLEFNPQTIY
ncbi:glycoside hydrolase family 3 protein [Kiritimatiellaeota bacterium B1221]|nr:glycoside hydrolase family 3 protein [Kiritimatiellaeota bacterium B1221]